MNNIKNWIKKRIITGLILLLPAAISLWIVIKIFRKIDGIFTPLINKTLGYPIPGVGFFLTLILIWMIGIIGTRVIGKRLFLWIDKFMLRIPIIKTIYSTTKQLVNAFELTKKLPFKQVILFEYPRRGILTIGFITGEADDRINCLLPFKALNVFFVTTPNPTSGFLFFLSENDIIPLNMNVEDALKMVISGGIYIPSYSENSKLVGLKEIENKAI